MTDPTSEAGLTDPDEAPDCEVCGDPIVDSPTHRVVTAVEDGEAVTWHFCSADHRDAWLDGEDG